MRALGLRARIVALTTGLLAVVLAAAALTLAVVVARGERAATDAQLRRTAADVAVLVDESRLPVVLPVSGARLVQVVDDRGAVVAASQAADRLTPLLAGAELEAARGGAALEVPAHRVAEPGALRVVGAPAGRGHHPVTVLAATPAPDLAETQRGLWLGLAVGVPLLLLVASFLLARAVGAALRPVDALRVGAERIGGTHGGGRLPVPATRDEIHALALTLNGMLDRLDAAADLQRRFVADAAHELRSPVASLHTQVEVAARLGDGGTLPAELLPDVERLGRLVDDLLLLARVGAPHAAHRAGRVDAAEVAGHVTGRYASTRVPVRCEASGPAPVVAERLGVERALSNLLDNAVRHARSRVDVRVRRDGRSVVVEVTDDGSGIPAADRERVFDRFTRLDEARDRDAGGSGLGLAIAREVTRRDGGDITLHGAGPDDGPGLRARLVLPAAP